MWQQPQSLYPPQTQRPHGHHPWTQLITHTTPFNLHPSMLHTGGWPADRQALCTGEDASQVCRALRLSPLILLQPAPACSPESFFRRWEGLGNGAAFCSCSDVLKQHLQPLSMLSGQSMHARRAVLEHVCMATPRGHSLRNPGCTPCQL